MKFSQRIRKTAMKKDFQVENIDNEFRHGIWNIVKMCFLDELGTSNTYSESEYEKFSKMLWHKFFKLPIDSIPDSRWRIESQIRVEFYNFEWYKIYDLIEFIINIQSSQASKDKFINSLNILFESEFSGYRIIEEKVVPISNQLEFTEISDVLEKTKFLTALKGANIHLSNALDLISDKKNPDYRNSVKESISAVESTCRIITGENTLGKSLNKLESKGLIINRQFKAGFDKIYAYTNDKENGIRHAIVTEPIEPDFADAKYMLISCSAFINFLVYKAEKIGIEFMD